MLLYYLLLEVDMNIEYILSILSKKKNEDCIVYCLKNRKPTKVNSIKFGLIGNNGEFIAGEDVGSNNWDNELNAVLLFSD